jgi:hypothetical protein
MKRVESVRVEEMRPDRVQYGERGFAGPRERPDYRVELVIRTDDHAWIAGLIDYLEGRSDTVPEARRPQLVSAAPALPAAPIEGTFEDQ